ncbi:MAG: fused MFS/spermidine synthase [Candidatus Competibacteraceae bacterium]
MPKVTLQQRAYFCFFLSGAAGLIYEVVWARQLGLFLGITTYAHTAVITAYMAGLAAGSFYLGRYADRRTQPLRFYAWLEIAIGLYAALTPWFFPVLQTLYADAAGMAGVTGTSAHLSRFALALPALLIPTFLMGGTLPLLVRGLTRTLPELGSMTSRLYGINTLGATLGAFTAGYLLLPFLGISGAIYVGVILNLGVAVAMLNAPPPVPEAKPAPVVEKRRHKDRKAIPPPPLEPPPPVVLEPLSLPVIRSLLLGFALAGFASLLCQLAWIRALILIVGSSVYAFTITLTSFLAGIGLGSLIYGRLSARRGVLSTPTALTLAAALAATIGFTILLGLPLLGGLPDLFMQGYQEGLQESFPLFQAFIFSLNFLIMLLPTLGMGALFPLIAVLWTRNAEAVGRGVGTAYAVNTVGTIFGALLGGLVLLPTFGIQRSILLAAGLYVGIALLFWMVRPVPATTSVRYGGLLAGLAGFVLAVVLLPPWDRTLMTSGVFFNADRYAQGLALQKSLQEILNYRKLLYYGEGRDGTVSVFDTGVQRILVINGKTDASSKSDLRTQVSLGQLPLALHPDPKHVLIIGLGSGMTAGAVAKHQGVEEITVLEISPEVVEASKLFTAENGDVLADPRVKLVLADARNYVLADSRHYDVIISEPSNPWISGISNLFTRDFFELAYRRLAPGGTMVQWLHTYQLGLDDLKSILQTFQSIFPHVTVWLPDLGDLILIGSEGPQEADYSRMQALLQQMDFRFGLERTQYATPEQVARMYLMDSETLRGYAADATINSDDRPTLEFNAPRSLYRETNLVNLSDMFRYQQGKQKAAPFRGLAQATAEGLEVPAMGLRVVTPASLRKEDWDLVWSVEDQMVEDAAKDNLKLGIGSQRVLTWREGPLETTVQAVWLETAPSAPEQQAYLDRMVQAQHLRRGRLRLPDGQEGPWLLGYDAGKQEIELAIAWTCPVASGGVTRYMAYRRLADPGEEQRESAVLNLADRFHCMEGI